jgi:predicted hotdog family 3-hydroxylacyl-ACP dehydratase
MKLPILVKDIAAYAPHRPPMIWIDEITATGDTSGTGQLVLKADALYMSPDGLRPSSCMEFIAQAYGFSCICHELIHNVARTTTTAFLASMSDGVFADAETFRQVSPGDLITVNISGVKHRGSLAVFDGVVLCRSWELASASLRAFRQ